MTPEEYKLAMIQALEHVFTPLYYIIGAGIAVITIALAVFFVLSHFIRRV